MLGLVLDDHGPDGSSSVERLLATHPFDDTVLLDRARAAMARMRAAHLTGAGPVDPARPAPPPGYVLVLDQPPAPGIGRNDVLEMLFLAREDHPAAPILLHGRGHLADSDLPDGVVRAEDGVSPWHLFEGAVAVWTHSAPLGFEAILAGHRPVVMGRPDWMGWGLTDDRQPLDRRQRRLTRAQLFAGLMLLAPIWYDARRDRIGTLEDVLDGLEAERQGLLARLARLVARLRR